MLRRHVTLSSLVNRYWHGYWSWGTERGCFWKPPDQLSTGRVVSWSSSLGPTDLPLDTFFGYIIILLCFAGLSGITNASAKLIISQTLKNSPQDNHMYDKPLTIKQCTLTHTKCSQLCQNLQTWSSLFQTLNNNKLKVLPVIVYTKQWKYHQTVLLTTGYRYSKSHFEGKKAPSLYKVTV